MTSVLDWLKKSNYRVSNYREGSSLYSVYNSILQILKISCANKNLGYCKHKIHFGHYHFMLRVTLNLK